MFMVPSVHTPCLGPMTLSTWLRWAEKSPEVPHSIASTAPRRSSIAAISVGCVRMASRASVCVTPLRRTRL